MFIAKIPVNKIIIGIKNKKDDLPILKQSIKENKNRIAEKIVLPTRKLNNLVFEVRIIITNIIK